MLIIYKICIKVNIISVLSNLKTILREIYEKRFYWKFDEETLTWVTLPSENSNNDRVFYNGANILKNNNVTQATKIELF